MIPLLILGLLTLSHYDILRKVGVGKMNCPKCGSQVKQGEQFCSICGTTLSFSTNSQVECQTNLDMNKKELFVEVLDANQDKSSNSTEYEQQLIDAYIGKNANKLKNGSFSFMTFLLGVFYVLYRKMWLLGIIWYTLNLGISLFVPLVAIYFQIVLNLIISIQFKRLYRRHVNSSVAKLKLQNPGKSKEELRTICQKKGGTTILPIFLFIIGYVLLLFITSFILDIKPIKSKKPITPSLSQQKPSGTGNQSTGTIGNLSITIPTILEKQDYSSSNYQTYELDTNGAHCALDLIVSDASSHTSLHDYLESEMLIFEYDTNYGLKDQEINHHTWLTSIVEDQISGIKEYYYATEKAGKFYLVEFAHYLDKNKVCEFAHNTIVDSLIFTKQ